MRWRLLLIGLAALAALVPLPSGVVESVYSNGLFPPLQRAVTTVSNLTPLPLFDVIVAGAAAWWGWQLTRRWRERRRLGLGGVALRVLLQTATLSAAIYLAFLTFWGWNYQRRQLLETLPFDRAGVSTAALRQLADTAVARANALYGAAHRDGWVAAGPTIDRRLAEGFWAAQRDLGGRRPIVPGRPKRTLFDAYFTRAGVAGMTDPFFLETFVASDLLAFERPHVIAHEWAHLAGYNDEGDANFVGWLACLKSGVPQQYSGWLFLYSEVSAALDRTELRRVSATLADGPRDDLRAIRARLEAHVNRRVSAVGWQVYDQYLKANRVEEGRRSYSQVVTLVLGTMDTTTKWGIWK